MAIYYSATKNAFYDSTIISTSDMPTDKVEISADEYASLLEAQNEGFLIVADTSGYPTIQNQNCSACTKTVHELEEATTDTLGHVKLDSTPTEGSTNAVTSGGIKKWVESRVTTQTFTITSDITFDCVQKKDYNSGIMEYWGVIPITEQNKGVTFTFPEAFSAEPLVMLSSDYDRVAESPGDTMPTCFSRTKDSVYIMGQNPAFSVGGISYVHFLIRGFFEQ